MRADEIRKEFHDIARPCFEPQDMGSMTQALIRVQAEIAAQLAELNTNLCNLAERGLPIKNVQTRYGAEGIEVSQ